MNIKDFGPCYDFSAPNKPAELLPETLAQIRIEDDWFEGTATVTLEFLPAPRIVAHGIFPAVPLEIAVSVASDREWSIGKRHVRELHVGGKQFFGFVPERPSARPLRLAAWRLIGNCCTPGFPGRRRTMRSSPRSFFMCFTTVFQGVPGYAGVGNWSISTLIGRSSGNTGRRGFVPRSRTGESQ